MVDEEGLEQGEVTESLASREVEDREHAAAEDDTYQQPKRTWHDSAYKYVNYLFDGMDPEVVFTFLTGESSAPMLTFLTAQITVKQGLKQFGKAGLMPSCQSWNNGLITR